MPNTSASAASASSDLYGMAVLQACEKIAKRLQRVRDEVMAEGAKANEGSSSSEAARLASLELAARVPGAAPAEQNAYFQALVKKVGRCLAGYTRDATRG